MYVFEVPLNRLYLDLWRYTNVLIIIIIIMFGGGIICTRCLTVVSEIIQPLIFLLLEFNL